MCSHAFMQHHSRRQRQSTPTCEAITTQSTVFACSFVAMLQVTRTIVVALCGARCAKRNISWNVLHAASIWTHTRAAHKYLVACTCTNTLLLLLCHLSLKRMCVWHVGYVAQLAIYVAPPFRFTLIFVLTTTQRATDNDYLQLYVASSICHWECLVSAS